MTIGLTGIIAGIEEVIVLTAGGIITHGIHGDGDTITTTSLAITAIIIAGIHITIMILGIARVTITLLSIARHPGGMEIATPPLIR